MMRQLVLVSLVVASYHAPSQAEPVALEESAPRQNVVYLEALGKLGVYGLGYERGLRDWLAVGGAGSLMRASHRTIVATSVYASVGTALSGKHRWFGQLGPELVRETEPAVPGFGGLSVLSVGGQVTVGYEFRGERIVLRGHAVMTFGKGGVAPWAGASIGLRL